MRHSRCRLPSGRHQIGTLAGFASEWVAGFRRNPHQNRDKLAELLGGRGQSAPAPTDPGAAPGASGGGLGSLLSDRRGEAPGAFLHSGLGEMLERFQQAGHGAAAQSWVNQGPNQELSAQHWSAPPGVDGTGRED